MNYQRGDLLKMKTGNPYYIALDEKNICVIMDCGVIRSVQGMAGPFNATGFQKVGAAEILIIAGTIKLPQWAVKIMNTSQTPITSNIPATSTPPPTGYPIGTVLHGTNARIGNLWIITLDNSYQASLLYDGRRGLVAPDESYKKDTMRPGMNIATAGDIILKLGTNLPPWARNYYYSTPPPVYPPLPIAPPRAGVITQVNKDLGLSNGVKLIPKEQTKESCQHEYKQYYGLTECYDYCIKCDRKRSMLK